MSVVDNTGAELDRTALMAKLTEVTQPKVYTANEDIYKTYTLPGVKEFDSDKSLLFYPGQVIQQSDVDALFTGHQATITTITPNTGAATGGTNVTVTGTEFDGVSGASIGGAAVTNFDLVSGTEITFTTPAGTAGAQDVVLHDADGDVTETGGFTYQ